MTSDTASGATPPALGWPLPWAAPSATEAGPANSATPGRAELFQEIYTRCLPIVFKTARAFAYSKEDREDLVQEILISLWEAADQFEARGKLSTYAYLVAYRRALNWKRGRRRYENKLLLFEHEQPAGGAEAGAGDESEAKIEWINRAIGSLKPIDRTICLLFLDGLPYGEIAEILGVTETVVGVRVHRCKQHLIAMLEKSKEQF